MDEEMMIMSSGEWSVTQAEDILKKYKACKTEHARNKLIPQIKWIMGRLKFEKQQVEKLIYGD